LVLPPRIAKLQAILIPVGITAKTSTEDKEKHYQKLDEIRASLKKAGVRVDSDLRDGYTPAWKFNDWELKGVPLRLEFGPKDAAAGVVTVVSRHDGQKGTIPIDELTTKGTSRFSAPAVWHCYGAPPHGKLTAMCSSRILGDYPEGHVRQSG
jgi:prolyl-tRNA synthetase